MRGCVYTVYMRIGILIHSSLYGIVAATALAAVAMYVTAQAEGDIPVPSEEQSAPQQEPSDTYVSQGPSAPLALDLKASSDSGSSTTDNITNNTTLTFTATGNRPFGGQGGNDDDDEINIIYKNNPCNTGAGVPSDGTKWGNGVSIHNADNGWHTDLHSDWRNSRGHLSITDSRNTSYDITINMLLNNNSIYGGQANIVLTPADGVKCFVVTYMTDSFGDSAESGATSAGFEVTLDRVASTPSLEISSGAGTATPTVRITNLENGSKVRLYTSDTCTAGALGTGDTTVGATATTASVALTSRSAAEVYYAKHTDVAGNTVCSSGVTNTAGTAAPSGLDLDDTTNSGSNTDNSTNSTTPKIVFTTESGATIEAEFTAKPSAATALNDAIPVSTGSGGTLAESGGSYTLTLPTLSEDGDYTVSVKARAGSKLQSSAATYSFTLDTVISTPSLTISSGAGTATPTVRITDLENGAKVRLYTSDTCTAGAIGTGDTTVGATEIVSMSLTSRTVDEIYYAKHTDTAGNTVCSSGVTNTARTATPSGLDLDDTTNSGSNDDDITNSTTPKITFTAVAGSTVTAEFTAKPSAATALNDAIPVSTGSSGTLAESSGSYTLTLPTLSEDGDYTVSIKVRATGKLHSSAATYSFTLDTTDPAIGTIFAGAAAGAVADGVRYLKTGQTAVVQVRITDESHPATGEVTLRFGDSEVDRTATAGTRVAGGSRDIGRASAATVSAQTAAGGVRVYPTDTAQQFLERYFKSVDPLAVVTVSSDRNFTVTSPFIAGATLHSMETAIYHSNGNYYDGDPMGNFTDVTSSGTTLSGKYPHSFDAFSSYIYSSTTFILGRINVPEANAFYPFTYDIQAGDSGVMRYKVSNVTDAAGNSITGQTSFTDVPGAAVDNTAPTLTATRIGTGNTRTYRVRATDATATTGRTKDNVTDVLCTTGADTSVAGWSDYTPGEVVGTAHDTNGRCVIVTDALGHIAKIHLSDSASVPQDFTLDLDASGSFEPNRDAILLYLYTNQGASASELTSYVDGGQQGTAASAITKINNVKDSANTPMDMDGNGTFTANTDGAIPYLHSRTGI